MSNQRAFSRVLPGSPSARPLVTRSYLSGWSVPPAPSPLPAQSRPPRPVARTLRPSPAPRAAAQVVRREPALGSWGFPGGRKTGIRETLGRRSAGSSRLRGEGAIGEEAILGAVPGNTGPVGLTVHTLSDAGRCGAMLRSALRGRSADCAFFRHPPSGARLVGASALACAACR